MAIIEMNPELFKQHVKEGDRPVMVEFWAPWCVYCRRIGPSMGKIAEQFADRLTVGQVNIDDHGAIAEEEKIEVIPTFVIYQNGEAVGSLVAPDSKAKVEAFIEETLGR